MLRYIFTSIIVLCTIIPSVAQNTGNENAPGNQEAQQDTTVHKKKKVPYPFKKRGTSLSIDITRYIIPLIDNNRVAFEASIRTNYKKRAFLVGEAGYENIDFTNDTVYSYNSNGIYARIGFDYDIFSPDEEGINDNILFGMRYGFAMQQHEASQYQIDGGYWEDSSGSTYYTGSISNYTVTTHWIEFTGGVRAEVLKNLYFCWLLRVKARIYMHNPEVLLPYRVPGLGKASHTLNLDFSYNVEYLIPWGNKKHKTKF